MVLLTYGGVLPDKAFPLHNGEQDSLPEADYSSQTQQVELLFRDVLFGRLFPDPVVLDIGTVPEYTACRTARFCISDACFGYNG